MEDLTNIIGEDHLTTTSKSLENLYIKEDGGDAEASFSLLNNITKIILQGDNKEILQLVKE